MLATNAHSLWISYPTRTKD